MTFSLPRLVVLGCLGVAGAIAVLPVPATTAATRAPLPGQVSPFNFGGAARPSVRTDAVSAGPGIHATVAGTAVTGTSTASTAIVGITDAATGGAYGLEGTSGNGAGGGVYGLATTGIGVYGQSQTGFGVEGINTNTTPGEPYQNEGIEGTSTVGPGVLASSSQGDGLYAFSGTNSGAFIESEGNAGPTLTIEYGDSSSNDGEAIDVFNNNIGDIMVLTASGDLEVAGTISGNLGAGTFSRTRNPSSDEALYLPQEAEAIAEDVGSAQLVNGSAAVPLGADFKATIDGSSAYMVFLTPYGDTNGLYVASRNSTGFVVREAHAGRSTVAFDYRIVARPYGARLARLPHVPAKAGIRHPGPVTLHR
jgi:hypothetical protein